MKNRMSERERRELQEVTDRSLEGVEKSAMFLALFTPSFKKDPVTLIQLALAVVLDKPIILAVEKGTIIPDNMHRLARSIEYFERDKPETLEAVRDMVLRQSEES